MSTDVLANLPPATRTRAAAIKLAAFDVDGTLTDGKLWYTEEGHEIKVFHAHDGHGLKLLLAHGIEVAIISARTSQPVIRRAAELGIRHVYQGQADKGACLSQLQQALGVKPAQTAFTGDDLSDVAAMRISGLAIAVANAHPDVLAYVQWQTPHSGGCGAVRDVCDLLLAAQATAP